MNSPVDITQSIIFVCPACSAEVVLAIMDLTFRHTADPLEAYNITVDLECRGRHKCEK